MKTDKQSIKLLITIFVLMFAILALYFYKSGNTSKNNNYKPVKRYTDEKYDRYISKINELTSCSSDSDCTTVDDGPCSCRSGGGAIAINKRFLQKANEINQEIYGGNMCPSVMSRDFSCSLTPVCKNSKCTLDMNSPDACKKTVSADLCYYKSAKENKDVDICKKINTGNVYFQICITELATALDNIFICDELSGTQKDDCKDSYYYEKRDTASCLLIKKPSNREYCLMSAARRSKNTENCKLLSDNKSQNDCMGQILAGLAIEKKDIELCKKIPESNKWHNWCLEIFGENIAKNNNPEPTIIPAIFPSTPPTTITKSKTLEDCKLLTTQKDKNICIGEVFYAQSKEKNDVSLCNQIPDYDGISLDRGQLREKCIAELSKK